MGAQRAVRNPSLRERLETLFAALECGAMPEAEFDAARRSIISSLDSVETIVSEAYINGETVDAIADVMGSDADLDALTSSVAQTEPGAFFSSVPFALQSSVSAFIEAQPDQAVERLRLVTDRIIHPTPTGKLQ